MIANPSRSGSSDAQTAKPVSSPLLLAVSWLIVLIPLAWGVYNTVKTSTNLFTKSSPSVIHDGAAH